MWKKNVNIREGAPTAFAQGHLFSETQGTAWQGRTTVEESGVGVKLFRCDSLSVSGAAPFLPERRVSFGSQPTGSLTSLAFLLSGTLMSLCRCLLVTFQAMKSRLRQ